MRLAELLLDRRESATQVLVVALQLQQDRVLLRALPVIVADALLVALLLLDLGAPGTGQVQLRGRLGDVVAKLLQRALVLAVGLREAGEAVVLDEVLDLLLLLQDAVVQLLPADLELLERRRIARVLVVLTLGAERLGDRVEDDRSVLGHVRQHRQVEDLGSTLVSRPEAVLELLQRVLDDEHALVVPEPLAPDRLLDLRALQRGLEVVLAHEARHLGLRQAHDGVFRGDVLRGERVRFLELALELEQHLGRPQRIQDRERVVETDSQRGTDHEHRDQLDQVLAYHPDRIDHRPRRAGALRRGRWSWRGRWIRCAGHGSGSWFTGVTW